MSVAENLIKDVIKNDKTAQQRFYQLYAPKMYGICLRFAGNKFEAEDLLQEGFIKVFRYLKFYRKEGSLEGWIRRTIVNTAINILKRDAKHKRHVDIDNAEMVQNNREDPSRILILEHLLNLVNLLPTGYRMVFNLYVIEGYSHKEISKMLGISENTSKSQLSRARSILQKKIMVNKNLGL